MGLKLTREDSSDLSFVFACLFSEAISKDEFKIWAYHVIEHEDHYPDYFIDICDFDGELTNLIRIIGFSPGGWKRTSREEDAIVGITYKRGIVPYEKHPSRRVAEKALESCPHIKKRFQETFPFILLVSEGE